DSVSSSTSNSEEKKTRGGDNDGEVITLSDFSSDESSDLESDDSSVIALEMKNNSKVDEEFGRGGGCVSYIHEEVDEDLLTIEPLNNTLNIVYRLENTMRFMKYIN